MKDDLGPVVPKFSLFEKLIYFSTFNKHVYKWNIVNLAFPEMPLHFDLYFSFVSHYF